MKNVRERKVLALRGKTIKFSKLIAFVHAHSARCDVVEDEPGAISNVLEVMYIVELSDGTCAWLKFSTHDITNPKIEFALEVVVVDDQELPPLFLCGFLKEGEVIKVVLEDDSGDSTELSTELVVLSFCAAYDERRRQSAPGRPPRLHSVATALSPDATFRPEDEVAPLSQARPRPTPGRLHVVPPSEVEVDTFDEGGRSKDEATVVGEMPTAVDRVVI